MCHRFQLSVTDRSHGSRHPPTPFLSICTGPSCYISPPLAIFILLSSPYPTHPHPSHHFLSYFCLFSTLLPLCLLCLSHQPPLHPLSCSRGVRVPPVCRYPGLQTIAAIERVSVVFYHQLVLCSEAPLYVKFGSSSAAVAYSHDPFFYCGYYLKSALLQSLLNTHRSVSLCTRAGLLSLLARAGHV